MVGLEWYPCCRLKPAFSATSNALFGSWLAAKSELRPLFKQTFVARINVGCYPDLCLQALLKVIKILRCEHQLASRV